MSIDWSKLVPYKTARRKSFEQLCFQIESRKYQDKGVFTPVDDSGGGDGVEFYLTLKDGSEWGWQAKYYEEKPRLNESGRKQKIVDSLNRAIEVHPNLTKWYLCISMDLTTDEKKWLDNDLPKHIPDERQIGIVFIGETEIHASLNMPGFGGLKLAFFGEIELSPKWFFDTFQKTFGIIEMKFDDLLYLENKEFEYDYLNPVLCNEEFLNERMSNFPERIGRILEDILNKEDVPNPLKNTCPEIVTYWDNWCSQINQRLRVLSDFMSKRVQLLVPNYCDRLSESDQFEIIEFYISQKEQLKFYQLSQSADPDTGLPNGDTIKVFKIINEQIELYDLLIREFDYFLIESAMPATRRICHCLGNGGNGKTNLMVSTAKKYLENELPALFIPASQFMDITPLSQQILALFDISPKFTFDEFLDCLDALGQINNARVPIIIDGLNEALTSDGRLNPRLQVDIKMLEDQILARQNLVFLTTSRISYKDIIWENVNLVKIDNRFAYNHGFTNTADRQLLISKYFNFYRIKGRISTLTSERFSKPLYLKIFCEAINHDRRKDVKINLGNDSLHLVFDKFIKRCDSNIQKRLKTIGYPPQTHKNVASNFLSRMARILWENNNKYIPFEQLLILTNEVETRDYDKTIAKALLNEELLLVRNQGENEENEVVYFTYDLVTGYLIAKMLISSIDNWADFLNSPDVNKIVSEDRAKLHPNYEDVLDSICTLLPILKGLFVHNLAGPLDATASYEHKALFSKSIANTILLSPHEISTDSIRLINRLAEKEENLGSFLKIADPIFFVANHPFNFSYWFEIIKNLELNKIDKIWSEFIRKKSGKTFDLLSIEFEGLLEAGIDKEEADSILEMAKYFMLCLCSTSIYVKKKCSQCLFDFGIKDQNNFLKLYYRAFECSDISIRESLSLVLYNLLLVWTKSDAGFDKREAEELGAFISNQILSKDGKYSTNHLLIEEYSIDILNVLLNQSKNNIPIDINKIMSQLIEIGVTNWQEAEDRNFNSYSEGNALLDYWFNKDKMPYIIEGDGDEYNHTEEFIKVQNRIRWRAYELGYDFNLFGDIDKTLAKSNWGNEVEERYADKYVRIAFLEYCGFLKNKNKLKTFDDDAIRLFKPFVDFDFKTQVRRSDFRLSSDYITQDSIEDWSQNYSIPDLGKILRSKSLKNVAGNWICLHGIIEQMKKKEGMQIYLTINGVLVKKEMKSMAKAAIEGKSGIMNFEGQIRRISNAHNCEMPDALKLPANDFKDFPFEHGQKETVKQYQQFQLIINGEILDSPQADEIWETTLAQYGFSFSPREREIGTRAFFTRGFFEIVDKEVIVEIFKKNDIALKEVKVKVKEFIPIEKMIPVMMPVTYLNNGCFVSKNMIDDMGLTSKEHDTDLYDKNGSLCSFVCGFHSENVIESFTFVKKEILDEYLRRNGLVFYTSVWGQRDFYCDANNWTERRMDDRFQFPYRFKKLIAYNAK